MSLISGASGWYYCIAISFSCYYAFRGYTGNRITFEWKNEEIQEGHRKFASWEIVYVFCLHDAIFHLVCSLAGFLALLVAYNLSESVVLSQGVDVGKSILLVFCFLFGVVGITGQLPALIQQGKLPGFRQP